ncbi:MAG: hypothetical protein LW859_25635 [Anabaena sp. 49633_E8]|nr:hypothetical protein [Anabaena sp. 49633_E8]
MTASCQCIKKAEMALIRLGFESKSNFAKHHLSRTTVTKFFQAITNYQLPITNYQLPITNYQLPITNYQLPITNYSIS